MTANTSADSAATVIIGQRVRAGLEKEFEVWQKDLNRAAADYAGFLGAEIAAPTPTQPDWVIVYRFDSIAHVQAWINSATRQDYLDSGRQFFDGPATQQVVSGGIRPPDPLLTVVVTHRVGDDSIDEFLAWQDRLREVESAFDGFRGTELFRPVDGVQDEWTLLYRFDNAAHLDTWLTSPERQQLLAEGRKFHDFELRTVDNSFGSWFAFDENGNEAPPPSETKTLDRGLGRSLPDCRLAHFGPVAAEAATVAGIVDRQSAVELHHEFLHDAVLRESAPAPLAASTSGDSCRKNQRARGGNRRRCDVVSGLSSSTS